MFLLHVDYTVLSVGFGLIYYNYKHAALLTKQNAII